MTHLEQRTIKGRARTTVTNAIKLGHLARPNSCSVCGTAGLIQGHHTDYAEPLLVTWLCVDCHNAVHAEEQREWHRQSRAIIKNNRDLFSKTLDCSG